MHPVVYVFGPVVVVLVVLAVLVSLRDEKKARAKEAKEERLLFQYGLIIGMLIETDYCEDAIPTQIDSLESFVVKSNGTVCHVNPFKNFDYSREQLQHLISWFSKNKMELWEESYYNFRDEKQRVKWCLKQIEAEEREK